MREFPIITLRSLRRWVMHGLCLAALHSISGCTAISLASATVSVAGAALGAGIAVGGAAVDVGTSVAKGVSSVGGASKDNPSN